jgi:hypothetical protein
MATLYGISTSPAAVCYRPAGGEWADYPDQPGWSAGASPAIFAGRGTDKIVVHEISVGFWHFRSGAWTLIDDSLGSNTVVYSIFGLSNGILYASYTAGSAQGVLKYDPTTGAWTDMGLDIGGLAFQYGSAVWASSETDVWFAAGQGGGVSYIGSYDGASWTARVGDLPSAAGGAGAGIWGTQNYVWFASDGGLFRYDRGANSWALQYGGTRPPLATWATVDNSVWTVGFTYGQSDVAIDFTDGTPVNQFFSGAGTADIPVSITGVDANEVYASVIRYLGGAAHVYETFDGGATWVEQSDALLASRAIARLAVVQNVMVSEIDFPSDGIVTVLGGHEITLRGIFPDDAVKVYLGPSGDDTDPECFAGYRYGYDPVSPDGVTLNVVTPPMSRGSRYVTVVDPASGDSAQIACTVVEAPRFSKVYSARASMNRKEAVGPRSMRVDPYDE